MRKRVAIGMAFRSQVYLRKKLFNHKKQSHLYCKSCHKEFIKEFGWGKCHCKNKGIVPMCKCGLLPIGCCYCCPDDTFSISFCSVCI